MAEILARDTDTRLGRGGLLIPNLEFSGDAHPRAAAEFMKILWLLNGIERFDADRSASDFGAAYDAQELVIPAADRRPVTVLRYRYEPPETNYDSPVEKYSVLIPPQVVGELQSYLTASFQPRPTMGPVEQRDCLFVEHSLGSVELIIKDNYECYGDYGQRQTRLLGIIMRELVDFVS